jgi:hypothetical protein
MFEVGSIDQGQFSISALVLHWASKVIFEYIGVYGPADHARAPEFLEELEDKVSRCQHPMVVGETLILSWVWRIRTTTT